MEWSSPKPTLKLVFSSTEGILGGYASTRQKFSRKKETVVSEITRLPLDA
jgi:hypothetical protein